MCLVDNWPVLEDCYINLGLNLEFVSSSHCLRLSLGLAWSIAEWSRALPLAYLTIGLVRVGLRAFEKVAIDLELGNGFPHVYLALLIQWISAICPTLESNVELSCLLQRRRSKSDDCVHSNVTRTILYVYSWYNEFQPFFLHWTIMLNCLVSCSVRGGPASDDQAKGNRRQTAGPSSCHQERTRPEKCRPWSRECFPFSNQADEQTDWGASLSLR